MKAIRYTSILLILFWSPLVFGFSTNISTISRTFDRNEASINEEITVTVTFTNLEASALRGFYYSDHIPQSLTVTTVSVKIDGSMISNYRYESSSAGDVYFGCNSSRWILETPAAFTENNIISSGSTVEIIYSVSSAQEGTYNLDEFSWAGYYAGGSRGSYGHSEDADNKLITFTLACTDADGDGYAVEGDACGPVDCDDGDHTVNPAGTEVCTDGKDNDCDGSQDCVDSECSTDIACANCTDNDGDGYSLEGDVCGPVDCDDTDQLINPIANEICSDQVDNDCDGQSDCNDNNCSSDPVCSSDGGGDSGGGGGGCAVGGHWEGSVFPFLETYGLLMIVALGFSLRRRRVFH